MISPTFRSEAAACLKLAAPLIAAQLTFIGMGVVDTVMAGGLGAQALAAVAVGTGIWIQAFILFMGVIMACSPIVAHRVGAGQAPEAIGGFVRQALVLALGLGLLWTAVVRVLAGPVIFNLGLEPATAELARDYLLAESWGGVFFCLGFTLRYCAEGTGISRVTMVTGVGALLVKTLFNDLLIYGHGGLPALGAVGCGWSTVIAAGAMVVFYGLQYRWTPRLHALAVFRPDWPRLQRESLELFRLGIPIGLILFAEAAFFGTTALLMARFGDTPVAAHQVAINFVSVAFMVPVGLGLATTVRVGQAAGAGAMDELQLRGRAGMALGLGFALFSATLMGGKPEWIIALYTRDAAVTDMAVTFLRYAALFQVFDCLQATANGALRGVKDTRVPMAITVIAYWLVGMPAGYGLAFAAGQGPVALWWGFIVGLAVAALGLSLRFLRRAKPF